MKNIVFAVFSLFVMMPVVMADCNTPVTVNYSGSQQPSDNEFLYETEYEFKLSKQGYINSGKKNSGDGHAYECDMGKSGGCGRLDVVTMAPGHIFEGQVIDREVKYQCKNPGIVDNRWVVVEDGICHTKGFGDIAVGDCVTDGTGGCKKLTEVDCSGYDKTDVTGIEFKGVCFEGPLFRCVATKCRAGMTVDKDGKCVASAMPVEPTPPTKPVKPVAGKCHPSVCTSELCKACCAKPSTETIWTPSVNKCVCVNGGDFVQEGGAWNCKASNNQLKYECDSLLMAKVASWKTKCADFADVLTDIAALETYCANTPAKDTFLRLYDELKGGVDTMCVGKKVLLIGEAQQKVQKAIGDLRASVADLEVSKWKTEEGKFNTARLASDSIAGVVLGTAGGLITSSVVKKHQVEDGFEDLNCTIGGQTVAGWGDEFTVGIH